MYYRADGRSNISVVGDHHVISVDGQQVLDFKDGTFAGGMAGPRSWNHSKVDFRSHKTSGAQERVREARPVR